MIDLFESMLYVVQLVNRTLIISTKVLLLITYLSFHNDTKLNGKENLKISFSFKFTYPLINYDFSAPHPSLYTLMAHHMNV